MAELWTPTLEQVADHIPTRTRDASTPGSDTLLGTFTAQTTPTSEQAIRQIKAAVNEVLSQVGGTVPTTPAYLQLMASQAASLRAAADIELAYPDRQADISTAQQLDQRAKDALAALKEAINDVGSGTEGSLLPQYAFPDPPWWGDFPL